ECGPGHEAPGFREALELPDLADRVAAFGGAPSGAADPAERGFAFRSLRQECGLAHVVLPRVQPAFGGIAALSSSLARWSAGRALMRSEYVWSTGSGSIVRNLRPQPICEPVATSAAEMASPAR